jgi:hypothetical protein
MTMRSELKRKARKLLAPKPEFTIDDVTAAWAYGFSEAQAEQSEWNVRVGRRAAHRPFGSGRKFPPGTFWPAHELTKAFIKNKLVEDAIKRDPVRASQITPHLQEPSEREIAQAMGLWNEMADRPSDTYARYMREHRKKQESSNGNVLSS